MMKTFAEQCWQWACPILLGFLRSEASQNSEHCGRAHKGDTWEARWAEELRALRSLQCYHLSGRRLRSKAGPHVAQRILE